MEAKQFLWCLLVVGWTVGVASSLATVRPQRNDLDKRLAIVEERQKAHADRETHVGVEKRIIAVEVAQAAMKVEIAGLRDAIEKHDKSSTARFESIETKMDAGVLGIYTMLLGLIVFLGKWLFSRVVETPRRRKQ